MNLPTISDIISRFQLDIRGVIHIGAHVGQEYAEYKECDIRNMMFFEPLKRNYERLFENVPVSNRVKLFNLALGCTKGTHVMFVETANDSMSCSMLEPVIHLKQYPRIKFDMREMVQMDSLDNVFDERPSMYRKDYNMINIDVQGYELEVFRGSKSVLGGIDVIRTEVNFQEMYGGCCRVEELDLFLSRFNFIRVLTDDGPKYWGEALYIKMKS